MSTAPDRVTRAARHAALGDPIRLAIVDELVPGDRAPDDLARRVGIASNLLAHHLQVLEQVGLITRNRSSGDGRRRYVHLHLDTLGTTGVPSGQVVTPDPDGALFVCTRNSARSQLAAALWTHRTGRPSSSAGTDPAPDVHPEARAAAARAGIELGAATPRHIGVLDHVPALVVTVCDQAHEALRPPDTWLHWSVPDPVASGSAEAFDATLHELDARIARLVDLVGGPSTAVHR